MVISIAILNYQRYMNLPDRFQCGSFSNDFMVRLRWSFCPAASFDKEEADTADDMPRGPPRCPMDCATCTGGGIWGRESPMGDLLMLVDCS